MTTTDIIARSGKKPFWMKVAWTTYLVAVGLATVGWLSLLSYLALALSGY